MYIWIILPLPIPGYQIHSHVIATETQKCEIIGKKSRFLGFRARFRALNHWFKPPRAKNIFPTKNFYKFCVSAVNIMSQRRVQKKFEIVN